MSNGIIARNSGSIALLSSFCLTLVACGGAKPGGAGGGEGGVPASGEAGAATGGSMGATGGSLGDSVRLDASSGGIMDGGNIAADALATSAPDMGGMEARAEDGAAALTDGARSGPLTDETSLSFTAFGITSRYHRYAAGLDWNRAVGLLVYTDGSGEFGLKNPGSNYLLAGAQGLISVAKRNNMVLLTPLAPGEGCPDGDGTCWYLASSGISPQDKAKWSAELIKSIQAQYGTDPARVAFGGYSSGAQWTTEYFGPLYASELVVDGVAVAISFGGSPKVTPRFSPAFKANVPFVWDTGSEDSAYTGSGVYGVKAGYDWYMSNGFATTKLTVVPGLGHGRSGQFGAIMDREIKQHLP